MNVLQMGQGQCTGFAGAETWQTMHTMSLTDAVLLTFAGCPGRSEAALCRAATGQPINLPFSPGLCTPVTS